MLLSERIYAILALEHMKLRIIVEYDGETDLYASYCPELPGCTSCGKTEKEALENLKEAIQLYFEPSPIKLKSTAKEKEITL